MDFIKIREYGTLRIGEQNGSVISGYTTLNEKTFVALENFVLNCKSDSDDALEIMGISAKRGIGKVITAKNYVGIITLKDGTTIEILPKIYCAADDSEYEKFAKNLLIKMLRTIHNMPHITLQSSNVDASKMPLLELFIRMFIEEVSRIVKQGIKSNYETIEENATVFKGKIRFSEHIKRNFAHHERIYVAYDAFTANRPENRILKSALQYLYLHTNSAKNKRDIKYLLTVFDEVDLSLDYNADYAKIVPDRNTKTYVTALNWAKIFLSGKSFASFSGSEVALALLFPMDRLFESYIASLVRKQINSACFTVNTQHAGYYLFDEPHCAFKICPDIVIANKQNHDRYVMDTKWKILDENKPNNNISQGDMYQMYVYQKKYSAQNITLLYPLASTMSADQNAISYIAKIDKVIVRVCFIDLHNPEVSINNILGMILEEQLWSEK